MPRRERSSRGLAESHVAPVFGDVHVDQALGRPDPVVLPEAGPFGVLAVDDVVLPFDAGEVDAPLVAGTRAALAATLDEGGPGEGNLHGPAAVPVAGVVERAVDVDGGAQARDLPAVVGLAALPVGPV